MASPDHVDGTSETLKNTTIKRPGSGATDVVVYGGWWRPFLNLILSRPTIRGFQKPGVSRVVAGVTCFAHRVWCCFALRKHFIWKCLVLAVNNTINVSEEWCYWVTCGVCF